MFIFMLFVVKAVLMVEISNKNNRYLIMNLFTLMTKLISGNVGIINNNSKVTSS